MLISDLFRGLMEARRMPKWPTHTLRAGTILHHGTSEEFDPDEIEGPAWFSTEPKVAQTFSRRHGDGRVLTYRLLHDVELPLIRNKADLEAFFDEHGIEGYSAEDMRDGIERSGEAGWYIPNNYQPGDDILLVDVSAVEPVTDDLQEAAKPTIDPNAIELTVHGDVDHWADGSPYADYRFEITHGFQKLLTIYGGVNIAVEDRLTGLDTFYVVDINAYPIPGLEFDTTNQSSGAYRRGIRLGPEVMRVILRKVLTYVRARFPDVRHIAGRRTTGARKKWGKNSKMSSRLSESIEDVPRIELAAGTVLYHGTESRSEFRMPRSPAWFTTSFETAARWSGWRASDTDKGERRVLSFRLTQPLSLFDVRDTSNFLKVASQFDTENEPEDASPWAMAENLDGADGWYADDEVLVRNLDGLSYLGTKRVPARIKSFGSP